VHELKYDGYRIHTRLVGRDKRLLTRTGLDWTDRYEATAKAISALAAQTAYVDGRSLASSGVSAHS
jgi:bifunctional non-homologous end joining protein LigD